MKHLEQPRGYGDPPAALLAVLVALTFAAITDTRARGSVGPSLPSPQLLFYLSAQWPLAGCVLTWE